MANPKTPKNAPVAEPRLLGIDSIPFEQLQAELDKRIKAQAEEAAALETARVEALKAKYEGLNVAYQTSMGALADFTVALSPEDAALLGIKAEVARSPKGATLSLIKAHIATLAPGSSFTTASLIECVVPEASASTVRNALDTLGIKPTGVGKAARYFVVSGAPDGTGTGTPPTDPTGPTEDTSGTNKPTEEPVPAEPN